MKRSLKSKLLTLILVVMGATLGISTVAMVLVSRAEIHSMNRNTKLLLRQSLTQATRDFAVFFSQQLAKVLFNPVYKAEIGNIREVVVDAVKSPLIVAVEVRDTQGRLMWASPKGEESSAFGKFDRQSLKVRDTAAGLLLDTEIGLEGNRAGYLRLVVSNENLRKTIARHAASEDRVAAGALRRQFITLAIVAAFLFVVGLLISRAWAQRVISPLEQLKAGAQAIIAGTPTSNLRVRTGDEIEVLSESLDQMVKSEQSLRADLVESNQRLKGSEMRLAAILASMADALLVLDEDGKIETVNQATADLLGYSEQELKSRSLWAIMADPPAQHRLGDLVALNQELVLKTRDGVPIPTSFTGALLKLPDGGRGGFVGVARDLRETVRLLQEKATAEADRERAVELQKVQEQLVDVAHQAGMAEIATGIIHNIGNVLNSLSISTSEIRDVVSESRLGGLARLSALLSEHQDQLAEFLDTAKGRKVLPFFHQLCEQLATEHARIGTEVQISLEKIENIRGIISVQQTYSKRSGLLAPVDLEELLTDCVTLEQEALREKGIELQWEIEPLPPVMTEKSKLMQVVINLLNNATEAIGAFESQAPDDWSGTITMRLLPQGEFVQLEIADTGIGVDSDSGENLFSYGFTTKQDQLGYGLHYCANTIKQLGGTITHTSPGLGQGTTFICRLPLFARNK